jgi:hypothetical protein
MGDPRDDVDQPVPAEPTKKGDFIDHPREAEHKISNYSLNQLPEGVERDPAPVAGKSVLESVREQQEAAKIKREENERIIADQEKSKAEAAKVPAPSNGKGKDKSDKDKA